MKKIIVGIFLTLILFYGISVCAESNDIKIRLDGQILNTENWEVKPFVQDGKVMAPVRSFAETAGFSVGWSEYKVVTVERDEYKIWFTIGINVIHIGTKGNYNIDTVPYILNDKTILPIRCLAEALNMSVKWNSENNEVEIISTMPGTDDPSSEDWDRKVLNMQWCNSYILKLCENNREAASKYIFDLYSMSSGETVVYKSSEGSQCSVSLNTGDHYISIISDNDYVSSLAEIVALRILMGFNDYQHGENPSLKFELDNSLKKALNEPYSKEKTVIGETQKYRYEITLFNLSATLSNTYNKKSTIIDVK